VRGKGCVVVFLSSFFAHVHRVPKREKKGGRGGTAFCGNSFFSTLFGGLLLMVVGGGKERELSVAGLFLRSFVLCRRTVDRRKKENGGGGFCASLFLGARVLSSLWGGGEGGGERERVQGPYLLLLEKKKGFPAPGGSGRKRGGKEKNIHWPFILLWGICATRILLKEKGGSVVPLP